MQGRLAKQQAELANLQCQVKVQGNVWLITIQGPQTSPFEGGKFQIEFVLDSFPFQGPKVKFRTKVYHPNVDADGTICPQIIGIDSKWVPTNKITNIICKIKELMLVPNAANATNQDAGQSYLKNQWAQKARTWTQQYAK